ncbi:hypothetical protein FOZ62_001176 [Perkinsus olseni]|uniref:Uncharacterized protein n=1 Tax=Perkinsus olseni TaxID=32597 RepID=A0A7J6QAH4_PEROL|nr:hypothetical protein FOZ62_001176 [Perkinsus olseni]
MGCASSTVEVAEGEVYAIKMSGAKRAERSEYEVSKYEEPNIEDTDKEEGTVDKGGEKRVKGISEPAVMNPAEVPILVGASPDSVEEWHRKRRRSSNDFEEQMWKRCDFGNGIPADVCGFFTVDRGGKLHMKGEPFVPCHLGFKAACVGVID